MKKNAIKLTGLACIVALCMALAACAPPPSPKPPATSQVMRLPRWPKPATGLAPMCPTIVPVLPRRLL